MLSTEWPQARPTTKKFKGRIFTQHVKSMEGGAPFTSNDERCLTAHLRIGLDAIVATQAIRPPSCTYSGSAAHLKRPRGYGRLRCKKEGNHCTGGIGERSEILLAPPTWFGERATDVYQTDSPFGWVTNHEMAMGWPSTRGGANEEGHTPPKNHQHGAG